MSDQTSKLYTRADLVALDGVDDGALPFWFREGLLIPEPAEPRKHRRFSEGEAKIAALLGEARNLGLNVTAMRHLAAGVRGSLVFHHNLKRDFGPNLTNDRAIDIVESAKLDSESLYLAWAVDKGVGAIGLRPAGGGAWLVRSMPLQLRMRSRVEILFNLALIFAPFRGVQ